MMRKLPTQLEANPELREVALEVVDETSIVISHADTLFMFPRSMWTGRSDMKKESCTLISKKFSVRRPNVPPPEHGRLQ